MHHAYGNEAKKEVNNDENDIPKIATMTAVVHTDEKRVDLEDVLDKFSIYKSYHLQIAGLIFLGFATNTMFCSNFIFVAEETGYTCVRNSTVNNTTDCAEWLYDNPHSFVAEFQLANQEWKRTLVGTVHSFGYMVGLLIVGPLSDRFGRKNAFIMTGVLGGVFGVARSFSHSYWLYIAFEFLEAFIGDCCSPAYILSYTFGGFATSLAAWLVPYWRHLLQVLYTPALLFFFYKYLLDESPRWLLIKGHRDKAVQMQYWFGLPSLIFGLASLFGGFVTFLVPDIADDSLPDTISQAEELGKAKPKKSLSIDCANSNVTK
ncbi:Solute carrier family 22 member 1 [Papilio xuthus]|uniref:Solute carrier family 22 member 1 n=1 Tax=Papilio xuthus TaxID=66420 RepID=A0A194PJ10_PAPXU|nr:Solute carrier family 22 member 1 [Papilio xuthus]